MPPATRAAWALIRDFIPATAYLMGGTALALRIRHRVSQDLDFFLEGPTDLQQLLQSLETCGEVAVTDMDDRTLNCVFRETKLQFLDATSMVNIVPPDTLQGVRIGSLDDLLVSKLLVLTHRGAVRDYVDLWAIEQATARRVESGLAMLDLRYPGAAERRTWLEVIRALGYVDDVRNQPLPQLLSPFGLTFAQLRRYWQKREREIVANLGQLN